MGAHSSKERKLANHGGEIIHAANAKMRLGSFNRRGENIYMLLLLFSLFKQSLYVCASVCVRECNASQ